MKLFKQTKDKNKMEGKEMQKETKEEINEEKEKIMQREELKNTEQLKNSETNVGVGVLDDPQKNKPTFKERIKKFLKNKKAVAMVMEYILTIECFAMLFLLTTPSSAKAAVSVADEYGITWNYKVSNGKATNVYYADGPLGETVTIPSTVSDEEGNEYPVVKLYYNTSNNIFKGNNSSIKKIIHLLKK